MSTLLELTWRGALMLVVVASLDRLCAARISARVRRAWWLLVPLAFFVTVPLPVLPASKLKMTTGPVLAINSLSPHPAQPAQSHEIEDVPVAAYPRHGIAHVSLPFVAAFGAVSYLLVVAVRTRLAVRRWGRGRLCTDATLLDVLEDCKATANVTAPIGLVMMDAVPTPVLLGWLRPRILLPATLVASMNREQLRGVIFHELAHFRSLDIPCSWLFTLACALHWFNPAAHLALRTWERFREEAADEAAIGWLGQTSSVSYGETLLLVLRSAHTPPTTPFMALAIVESINPLRKRLTMIKHYEHKTPHLLFTSTVFVAAAAGILLRPVRAQDTTAQTQSFALTADQLAQFQSISFWKSEIALPPGSFNVEVLEFSDGKMSKAVSEIFAGPTGADQVPSTTGNTPILVMWKPSDHGLFLTVTMGRHTRPGTIGACQNFNGPHSSNSNPHDASGAMKSIKEGDYILDGEPLVQNGVYHVTNDIKDYKRVLVLRVSKKV